MGRGNISVSMFWDVKLHLSKLTYKLEIPYKALMVWALLLQLFVVEVTDEVIAEKIKIISSRNYRNFCLNCSSQVKL